MSKSRESSSNRALAHAVAVVLTLISAVGVGLVGVAAPASGAPQLHDHVVSDNPANWTPDVLDGRVLSLVEVGDRIVVAGEFSQVREKGEGKPTLTRNNIFAFDPTDGRIDPNFAPDVNGEVQVVLPGPDLTSVFLGGAFSSVDGIKTRKLARLRLADGGQFPGFKVSPLDALVSDLRLVRGELVLAGAFTTVGGVSRPYLASVDPDTGARTDFVDFTFAVPRRGSMSISKIDVTPDGNRLIAIGNFGEVNGQSRPQLAVFDTSGPVASLDAWRTGFFRLDRCVSVFWTYMRDLDIDPSGQYVVVSTTGAYGGQDSPCDVVARFELGATGTDIAPSWRNYTGGDTTYAVEITDSTVYIGGHMRWVNNPFAGDRAGAGAVPREGIAALDPRSGMPYAWNPGRERGVGVFDMLATDQGLFIGHDTERVAMEVQARLAFFPLGSSELPKEKAGTVPNDVYLFGDAGSSNDVRRQFLPAAGAPGNAAVINDGTAWSSTRGSFLIDDRVYAGWANGTMTRRTFDGTTFGPATVLDLYSGTFGGELANITGMFYDPQSGRIYYTRAGQSQLFWRGFSPDSEVVGPASFQAGGDVSALSPATVNGMFRSGDRLYFADGTSGALWSVGFTAGSVVGPRQLVDGSIDWRARGAFIWNGTPALAPNVVPVAVVGDECVGLSCSLSGVDSSDPDGGGIVSYEWDFGDGATASGRDVSHVFTDDGDFTVSLTVTDDRGGQDTAEVVVSVANLAPSASFTSDCVFLQCTFTSTSADPDGAVASYAWDFGDGGVASEANPVHVFAGAGDFEVTLTVTDARGVTDGASEVVTATDPPVSEIGYRGSASFSGNVTSAGVTVPSSVESGDALLLFVSTNAGVSPEAVPAGWQLVGQREDQNLRSHLYVRSATASSAGGDVQITLASRAKVDLTLLAYSGVDPAGPIAGWDAAIEPGTSASHAAPPLAVAGAKSWVVNFWVDKSSATDSWTAPVGTTVRSTLIGSGSGRLASVATDSGAPVLPGTWPAQVATASSESARAVAWTVALKSSAPNVVPVAVVGDECVGLSCSLSGVDSSDPDGGGIVSYEWDFGDGATASGRDVSHVFTDDGDFTVSLTVTDDRGGQDTAEVVVSVANLAPSASFTSDCVFLQCTFTSTSADPDGAVASYAWDFGDGGVASEANPVHVFAGAGDFEVTLTVTDARGVTDGASEVVTATDPPVSEIGYRGSASFSGNVTSAGVTVPSSVESGDALLLFVSTNAGVSPEAVPAGWQLVGQREDQNLRSHLYVRSATASSAGGDVQITLASRAKVDLTLLAYSGVDPAGPIAGWDAAIEPGTSASHAAPELAITGAKSWVVNFWVDKSSATDSWTAPVGTAVRSTLIGSGSGRLASVATDSGAPVLPGTWPAQVATASSESARAVAWTIALKSS